MLAWLCIFAYNHIVPELSGFQNFTLFYLKGSSMSLTLRLFLELIFS